MKILAFGASSSINSINKQLAHFAAHQIKDAELTLIDLNDFEMPIYSIDKEKASGIPKEATLFHTLIGSSDGILISFAEHNGSYSAAFKNIFDWTSRLEGSVWQDKPMFLMATSPGARGGASVLSTAVGRFPFNGGKVVTSFSLPSFGQNFSTDTGIIDKDLKKEFLKQLNAFEAHVQEGISLPQ